MSSLETKTEGGMIFNDIRVEDHRIYTFPDGSEVRIDNPQWLNVSKSGGHRIIMFENSAVYIPSGWLKLQWWNKPGNGAIQF